MDSGYMKQIRNEFWLQKTELPLPLPISLILLIRRLCDKVLNRLVQAGILQRVLRGIFVKPKFCSTLNEFVEVNPDAVAKTLARTYHWTITPYGNAALYLS